MSSAFGVDHGEVSKALPTMGAFHALKPPKLKPLKMNAMAGASGLKTGFKAAGNDFTPMKGLAQNKSFMTGAKVGNAAQKPGVKLGAAAGGAGLATGAGVGAVNHHRQKPMFGKSAWGVDKGLMVGKGPMPKVPRGKLKMLTDRKSPLKNK